MVLAGMGDFIILDTFSKLFPLFRGNEVGDPIHPGCFFS